MKLGCVKNTTKVSCFCSIFTDLTQQKSNQVFRTYENRRKQVKPVENFYTSKSDPET
jgi:hypothetical protein